MKTHNSKTSLKKKTTPRSEETIETLVLQFLNRHKGMPFKQKKIAREIGITSDNYVHFKQIMKMLTDQQKIEKYEHSLFRVPDDSRLIEGVISFSGRGFAFVKTDSGDEIFISADGTSNALHLDRVLIEKYTHSRGLRPEGKVVKIIARSERQILGTLQRKNDRWIVLPAYPAAVAEIDLVEASGGLKEGQLVELENIEWDDTRVRPRATLKNILGFPENPQDDLNIVVKMFRLSDRFAVKVLQEAEELPEVSSSAKGRLDLRQKEIFTIDPPDAKDFDDAVSLEKTGDGRWLLGVHIADVSHFVRPGSALDRDARHRGTSVYLGENVIPMLPERVSNELCSLKPKVDRLAFSVLMTLNEAGIIQEYSFAESIIRSVQRFSYEEVQAILDRGEGPHHKTLEEMRQLSRIILSQRNSAGSIDFDIPEPVFKMGPGGIPMEVMPGERLDSHRLIEEFMLCANKSVAEFIAIRRKKDKLPFLYRIHPQPPEEDIIELYQILKGLGVNVRQSPRPTPAVLQKILHDVQGMPYKNFIEQVTLRSMSKAIYSHLPLSHFGLAFRYYTHFTSPIRRYPDLIVHRLLKNYLGEHTAADIAFYRRSLPQIANLATEREIQAMEAERAYRKIKQVRFMADKVGNWYKGIISGVREFGFFVSISQFLIEGLVHIRTFEDDYYIYDGENHLLHGRRGRRKFRLGDEVMVKVTEVSIRERRIDLEWGE